MKGQSLVEYTMLVGVITLVLFYMGSGIKRGLQSLVKVTADQVGSQQNADQDFSNPQAGYMIATNTSMNTRKNKQVTEFGNSTNYTHNVTYDEYSNMLTNTITNAGFTPDQ